MRKKFVAVMLACSFVSTVFYQANIQTTALAAAGLERVTSVSGVRTSGTSATIRFAKVKKASGYQVVYATNKTFSANKRSKKTTKTTVRLLSLKSKKTYYVKVRGFRTKKGKISYGAYSKVLVLQNLSTPQVTPTVVPDVSGTPAVTTAQASSTPIAVTTPAVSGTPDVTVSVSPTVEVTPKVTASVKPTMEVTPKVTASVEPTMETTPKVTATVEPTMKVTPEVTSTVEPTMEPTPKATTTVEPTAEVTPTIAPTTEPTAVIEPTITPTPDPEGIVYKDVIHKTTHEKIKELSDKAVISDSVLGYTEAYSYGPPKENFDTMILTSLEEYEDFSSEIWSLTLEGDFLTQREEEKDSEVAVKARLDEDFFEQYNLVIMEVRNPYETDGDVCIHEAYIKDNALHIPILFAYYEETPVKYHMTCFYHLYAVGKNIVTAYEDVQEKIYPGKSPNSTDEYLAEKPIIYLYPEKEQEISVTFAHPENLTVTYPKYKDSWNVMARPDGTLTDLSTGRELYSLYYECKNCIPEVDFSEGFVVKGEDSAAFLEEKLEILGLNYKEAEEFIVYWLPRLEANPYNYIRFADKEEIDQLIPLTVSGNPDTMIRVLMEYMPLEQEISVKEQILTPVERSGFTVVEWGGTCLEK